MSSCWGVVVACGKAEKFAPDIDTAFLTIGSRPILTYSLAAYEQCPDISGVVVVAPKDRLPNVQVVAQMFGYSKVKRVVAGGQLRSASVLVGLRALDENVEFVSIHDASRPCITPAVVADTLKAARKQGAAALAVRVTDAIKLVQKGCKVKESLTDGELWATQSPQAFKVDRITKALESATKKKVDLQDDVHAVELLGDDVVLVPNDRPYPRVMSPADLALAEQLLRR